MPNHGPERPRWATRIAELRRKLGMSQKEFSTALNTGQYNISRWEAGSARPSPDAFAKMGKLAPVDDKFYFLDEAGLPREFFMGGIESVMPSQLVAAAANVVEATFGPKGKVVETYMVPILTDAVAAGNPLTINERDIEMIVPLPSAWLPRSSRIFGLRVEGDSMEPILHDKDIVLVDVTRRDLKKLIERMVAVRVGEGVTIKWLRKSGKYYQLVPQHTSPRHEIRIVGEEDDWAIVGEVVKWIGEPPPPPKKGR